MSDSSPGLLARLGPLGFLTTVLLVSVAFTLFRSSDESPGVTIEEQARQVLSGAGINPKDAPVSFKHGELTLVTANLDPAVAERAVGLVSTIGGVETVVISTENDPAEVDTDAVEGKVEVASTVEQQPEITTESGADSQPESTGADNANSSETEVAESPEVQTSSAEPDSGATASSADEAKDSTASEQPPASPAETSISADQTDKGETVASTVVTQSQPENTEVTTEAPVEDSTQTDETTDNTATTSESKQSAAEVTAAASGLVNTARTLFEDRPLIDSVSGRVADSVKTGLIELVDALKQNENLVVGIAASLSETLGILGFPVAEKHALAVQQFFVDNGVPMSQMVAGVLVQDYEPEDGIRRQVAFFFAERN